MSLRSGSKKLVPANCGVNYHLSGKVNIGGLPEDFPNGQFKTLHLDVSEMETTFAPGIVVPLRPFLGGDGGGAEAWRKTSGSGSRLFWRKYG